MELNYWFYDIELMDSWEPFFLVCLKNRDTQERKTFEYSQWKDEVMDMIRFLESNPKPRLIGFNNLNYDSQLIEFIKQNADCSRQELFNFGQQVIDSQWPIYPEWKLTNKNLDLFKIHHLDNDARICSLKWIQFSMDWPNIEDLPFNYDESIDWEKSRIIEKYCWNDIDSTEAFYWITKGQTELPVYKGKDMIQMRQDISTEFKMNCMNYSDSKIGDEFIKGYYCKQEGLSLRDLPRTGTIRYEVKCEDCLITPIEFKSKVFNNLYNKIKSTIIDPANSKDLNEIVIYKDLKISYGGGGLHSEDNPRQLESNAEYSILDCDVSGYYPAKIKNAKLKPAHLTKSWTEGVSYFYTTRLEHWKPLAKKDKKAATYSEAFKLAGNAAFGKTNSKFSWACDPLVAYTITLDNQFLLLKLCEDIYEAGIQVLTINTDGISSYVHNSQKKLLKEITDNWCKWTGFELEWTNYSKYVQTSVNDYIAIKTDGSVKEKGDFLIDREIFKNKSRRIVPIALRAYFVDGISIEETIRNHKNVFDFCIGMKATKGNAFYTIDNNGRETKLQKTIRFIISNKGVNILKTEGEKRKVVIGHPQKGKAYYKTVLNKCTDSDATKYNICYDYYITECRKIVVQVEKNQLELF